MVYGEPRMTHGMDLVLDIQPEHANQFAALFPQEEFYCPPMEVLKSEIVHRGQFNLIHQGTRIKIDIMIRKNTEHSRIEFQRRKKVPFWEGHEAYLACPEDVIIKKLSFYREGGSEKHLMDIRGIMVESEIHREYLIKWIERLSLQAEWRKVSK